MAQSVVVSYALGMHAQSNTLPSTGTQREQQAQVGRTDNGPGSDDNDDEEDPQPAQSSARRQGHGECLICGHTFWRPHSATSFEVKPKLQGHQEARHIQPRKLLAALRLMTVYPVVSKKFVMPSNLRHSVLIEDLLAIRRPTRSRTGTRGTKSSSGPQKKS